MLVNTLLLVGVVVVVWTQSAHGLYEEQAGVEDWRKQFIGEPKEVAYDSANKRIIVGTAEGALAALGSMTGKIAWRQLLPSSHSIDRVLLKNSMLITVSAGGSRVQRWDRDSGLQLWQHANHAFTDGRSGNGGDADRWGSGVDASILEEQDITTVISLAGNILTSRRVKDGEATWQTSVCDGAAATAATDGDEPSAAAAANGNDACSMRLVALGSDGQLVTYGTTADSIVVKTFTLRGKATGTKTFAINSANKVQGFKSCQIVGGDNLMCIGSEAGAVHMLWNNAEGITTVNVEGEDVAFSSFDAVADDSVEPVALIRYATGVLAVRAVDGAVTVVNSGPNNAEAMSVTKFEGKDYITSISRESAAASEVSVSFVAADGSDSTDGAPSSTLPAIVVAADALPTVRTLFVRLFRRNSDQELGMYSVASMIDQSMAALRGQQSGGGNVAWVREEGLANIEDVAFVDLPAETLETEALNLITRITTHVGGIAAFAASLASFGASSSEDAPHRDPFNMHKYIIAATASGKVFGMDSQTGAILWQRQPSAGSFAIENPKLHVLRSTIAGAEPLTALAGKTEAGYVIEPFNPLTGVGVQGGTIFTNDVKVVVPSPCTDREGSSILLILDGAGTVHTFPESADAAAAIAAHDKPIFVHQIDKTTGIIAGSKITADAASGKLSSNEIWTLVMRPENEQIAAVGFKYPGAQAARVGVILGDKSVMHKYLNPNMISIATMSPAVKGFSVLNVYLIDVVRGAILQKVQHRGTTGDVHMVQSENWVSYHYRNRKMKRYEMGMLELFDASENDPSKPFTSRDATAPINVRQAYIFPHPATAMGLTTTTQGATETQVLVALPSGAVMGIHKRFLDARRPTNDKAAKHAEGLIPYHPVLAIPPQSNINYNQTVLRTKKIYTSTTGLESTCLVFATGMDLFFTPATPSKKFDALTDEFPRELLGMALSGLFVTVFFIKQYSQNSVLQRLWR